MPSISQEVQQAIAAAEIGASSGVGARFAARASAIEYLEVHVLDRLHYLAERASLPADLLALRAQAADLRRRLEAANQRVLRTLHRQISAGRYTPEGLKRAFARHAGPPGSSQGGYDTLDLLVGGLLGGGDPPEPRAVRGPEMVFYQPTPARAILALIERANLRPDEVLYDLGSGLGHVVILVALLSVAHARGIEFEPAYCEYSAQCARRLNVRGVEFIQADAREASLADGTVFSCTRPFETFPVSVIHPAALPPADIVKLDVEGAESEILRHMDVSRLELVLLEYQDDANRIAIKDLLAEKFALVYEDAFAWDKLLRRPEYRPQLAGNHFGRMFFANRHRGRLRKLGPPREIVSPAPAPTGLLRKLASRISLWRRARWT